MLVIGGIFARFVIHRVEVFFPKQIGIAGPVGNVANTDFAALVDHPGPFSSIDSVPAGVPPGRVVAVLQSGRTRAVLVVSSTGGIQNRTRFCIDRDAEIGRVIRTCQERRRGWVTVVVTRWPAVGERASGTAAWTILHGDDGSDQLGIQLQLLGTG